MKNFICMMLFVLSMIGATVEASGQNMNYLNHQELSLATASGLAETWVQLPNADYVRVTSDGNSVVIESTAGWNIEAVNGYVPCIAQYDGTIWCAFRQSSDEIITIGGYTFPATGTQTAVLAKINSSGSVLGAWNATGSIALSNIAVKNNNEVALIGSGSTDIEHLTSPNGGGVVLIHNGNDWDVTKGFFLETPSGSGQPSVSSANYLTNGNLAIAGDTHGGAVDFGGLPLSAYGGKDGFRGEITSTGVGISVVQTAGNGTDQNLLQITADNGSFMVSGTYTQEISFYNADGSVGGTMGQFPTGASHDHVFFAFYNAAGIFQNAEVAYNTTATTSLLNIDLAEGNDAFYAMIGNTNGGTAVVCGNNHSNTAPIILKFDLSGESLWTKQVEGINGANAGQYGEEILINGDIIAITGSEGPGCDLDFGTGVVEISSTSYCAEYFDGIPEINFNPISLNADWTASNPVTVLTSNVNNVSISIDGATGAAVSPSSCGAGNTNVTATIPQNLNLASRVFTLTASHPDAENATCVITQDGRPAFIEGNPDEFNWNSASNTATLAIDCNPDLIWNVTDLPDWITATQMSGQGPATITLNYEENPEMISRNDTFSVSGSGATEVISVTQVGANAILSGVATATPDEISLGSMPIELGAQGTGGTGSYSYSWTSVPVGFTSNEQNPTDEPIVSTTYACQISDGEDMYSTSVDVIVHALPIVDFSADNMTPHIGDPVTFTPDISYPGNALEATSFEWTIQDDEGGLIATSSDEIFVWTAESGEFDVKLVIRLRNADGSFGPTSYSEWENKLGFISVTDGVDDYDSVVETSVSNYPNPFRYSTTISLQGDDTVEWKSLDIYNIHGQLVRDIRVDGICGSYNVVLNMSDNASGIYFVRAVSSYNGKIKNHTFKLTLMK